LLHFTSFFCQAGGVVGDYPQVAFSTLDLLRQPGSGQLARHCLAFFATDGFVQDHDGVFQLNQPPTGIVNGPFRHG
jgi:hypothetical protein